MQYSYGNLLVRAGERPFHCRLCGNSFTTNGNMHRHMKTHQNEAGIDLHAMMGCDKKRRRRGGSSARSGSPIDSQSLANSHTQSMLQGGLLAASEPRDSVADTGVEEDESLAGGESCARLSVDSASVSVGIGIGRKTALVASEDAPVDVPSPSTASFTSPSVPALLPPPPADEWQSLSITRSPQSRVPNANTFSISVLTSNSAATPTASSSSAAISAVPAAPASIASSSKSRSTGSSKRSQRAAALKQRLAAAVAADAAAKEKDATRASTPCSIDMKFRRNAAPVAAVAPVATPPPLAPLASTSAIAPVLASPASESGALVKSETLDVKPNAASNEDVLKLLTAMLASSQQQSPQPQPAAGAATSAASAQQPQLSSVLSLLQSLPVQSLLASAFVNAISMNLVGLITNAGATTSATSPTSLSSVPTLSTATAAGAAGAECSRPALASCNAGGELKCAALDEEQRSPLEADPDADADADEAELKQSDEDLKSDVKSESVSGRKRARAVDNSIHPCKICGEPFATLNAMRGTLHWLLRP